MYDPFHGLFRHHPAYFLARPRSRLAEFEELERRHARDDEVERDWREHEPRRAPWRLGDVVAALIVVLAAWGLVMLIVDRPIDAPIVAERSAGP